MLEKTVNAKPSTTAPAWLRSAEVMKALLALIRCSLSPKLNEAAPCGKFKNGARLRRFTHVSLLSY
jgi:hypothetical protein